MGHRHAYEQFFHGEGRLDVEVTTFEGRGYARVDYDQDGSGAWRSNALTCDGSRRLIEDFVVFDTGEYTAVWFDVAATEPWTTQSASYDASGRLHDLYTSFDDGHLDRAAFDLQDSCACAETRSSMTC